MLQLCILQEHGLSLPNQQLYDIDDVGASGHLQFQGVGGIHIALQTDRRSRKFMIARFTMPYITFEIMLSRNTGR